MMIAGLAFKVEGTGGNCTAAVARVEGGVIALTDGNLGTDWAWAAEQGWPITAGWYPGTAWDDGECDVFTESGDGPDAAVTALIDAVKAGA